jgi:hypothetical protein
MRVISIFRPQNAHQPPTQKMSEDMGKFMVEAVNAGILIATEGFGPSTKDDLKVRYKKGDFQVTDGPFTETKEVIGGFAIMQFKTREEMLDWTRRFMEIAGEGECEIHKLSDMSPIDMIKG